MRLMCSRLLYDCYLLIVLQHVQTISAEYLSSSKPFCDSVTCCAETDSDPISETTPIVSPVPHTAVDTDSVGAHNVANDSLLAFSVHGK